MANEAPSLVRAVETFLKVHDMAPVTFGRLAMNDPHFVRDIRAGRRLWPETENKVRAFMASHASTEAVAA